MEENGAFCNSTLKDHNVLASSVAGVRSELSLRLCRIVRKLMTERLGVCYGQVRLRRGGGEGELSWRGLVVSEGREQVGMSNFIGLSDCWNT